jgi:hypothetical protein
MNPFMNSKLVSITPPAAIVDNASFTTAAVDTRGYDWLRVTVYLGATDIAMTALKLQESNDDGSSDAYADISGAVFGTSTGLSGSTSTLPSATGDNLFYTFLVKLNGRKRYIDVVATAGDGSAGTYAAIFGELGKGEEQLFTPTGLGASQVLVV